jgi:transposase InsO family protein
MDELLREVYYNPQTGFRSIDETLRQARALNNERQARAQRLRQPYAGVRVDREDVKRFLESQEVRQQVARRRREGSYVATAAREEFECDLAEFPGSGARYALVCVDVFSKKCAAVPMVDKRPQTTADALKQCFSELGVPVRIYTDEGSEFQNGTVESFLTSLNVALVTTRSYANFAERMIRTLKERLRIRQLAFGEPWEKLLPDVVKQYNDQAHAATRMAPKLAALDANNDAVRAPSPPEEFL